MPQKTLQRFFTPVVKGLVTVLLLLLFAKLTMDRWQDYRVAKIEAQFSQLGYLMPRDIRDFVVQIEKDRQFDPEQLSRYIAYYQSVVKLLPQKADAHGMLGFCLYQAGHDERAIAAYHKAIGINRHFFWFHYNLGSIYYKNGRYEEAARSFKTALEKSFDAAMMFIQLSRKIYHPLIVNRSDYSGDFLKEKYQTDSRHSYAFLIRAYYALEKFDEVIKIAHYADSLSDGAPDKEFLYYYMGVSFFQKKENEKAIFFLQKALERNPKNADAFGSLGMAAKALGKEDIAVKYLGTARYLRDQNQHVPVQDPEVRLASF